jgi:NADH-quinone oxidoreductase subunit N
MNFHDLQLPGLLALLGLVVLVLESLRPVHCVRGLGIALAGMVGVLFCYSLTITPSVAASMGGMYHLDAFALYFQKLFLAVTALVLLMGAEYSHRFRAGAAEFYVIALFSAVGMLFCAAVKDFILLFVALELVTVAFYVLVSYLRSSTNVLEAGMKYLVFGALASGVLVYGLAYVFGTTGSTRFDAVRDAIAAGHISGALGFGIVLTLAGLCFKIAAVPAQMWAPDVYQGAPTPTTAFLASGSKAVGFALLTRVLFTCFLPARPLWAMLILALAALSLLWGNLGAIAQTNLKRIFGYSSIAHAGYLLIGIAAVSAIGAAAVLFYLVQYAFTGLCAFLVLTALKNANDEAGEIASLNGLHRRSPFLAAALALSMLSLAGVPPMSGFFAKFMLFFAALEKGVADATMLALVLIACVGVVISLYVYFKVIRAAYFEEPFDAQPVHLSAALRIGILMCLAVMLVAGLYPAPLWNAAVSAAAALGLP